MTSSNSIRVGVDIGGTFTDIALEHKNGMSTCKVLTNYSQPEQAILDGIAKAAEQAEIDLGSIEQVIHGTTLVTNSLIERRGAKLAFITTEGFRDVIEMRSENRFEQYDLNLELPKPLVERKDRFTLNERMGPDGDVLLALDHKELDALVKKIIDGGYEAVAIGFMHAYANDAHEKQVEAALKKSIAWPFDFNFIGHLAACENCHVLTPLLPTHMSSHKSQIILGDWFKDFEIQAFLHPSSCSIPVVD